MVANVETMFSVNVTPWHGLGIVVEEAPDSIAAIKMAGLDWTVDQKPIYINPTGNPFRADSYAAVPNAMANVRSDNDLVLGIVTERYKIVQNQEAFAFTDELVKGGEVKYETAGSLKEGRSVWMMARMNREYDILGDKFDPYLCFTNSHDGTGAVRVCMTPIRVVCQNTLNMAFGSAKRTWSTTHVGDIALKIKEAERTLGLAMTYMEKLDVEANKLVDIKIDENIFKQLLNDILPINDRATDRQIKTIQEKREGIYAAMKADDIKKFRGTGWQLINAVSDFVTHGEPARRTSDFRANNFSRVIAGESLFDRTYDFLRKIA